MKADIHLAHVGGFTSLSFIHMSDLFHQNAVIPQYLHTAGLASLGIDHLKGSYFKRKPRYGRKYGRKNYPEKLES